MSPKEIEIRKLVLRKFIENSSLSGRSIAKDLKLHQGTVNHILKRYKKSLSIERRTGSGGNHTTRNKQLAQKIIRSIKQNPGLSDSDRAKKLNTSRSTVRRTRLKAGFKSYRAIKHPNRSDKQSSVAKKRGRRLYDEVLTKHGGCILMDDETYVKCDFKQVPGRKFYSSTIRGNVPCKYKYVMHDKYAKKMMIWQAICSCGKKSRGFVTSSTMNSTLYMKECLQKRLLPLIKSHDCQVKFWPDLASCHYSNATMKWYEANQVDVISKIMNPPNCPELRPIEKYWAIVKNKLMKNAGAANDVPTMTRKWNQNAGKVSDGLVQKMMSSIKTKTRKFFRSNEL